MCPHVSAKMLEIAVTLAAASLLLRAEAGYNRLHRLAKSGCKIFICWLHGLMIAPRNHSSLFSFCKLMHQIKMLEVLSRAAGCQPVCMHNIAGSSLQHFFALPPCHAVSDRACQWPVATHLLQQWRDDHAGELLVFKLAP